MLKVGLPMETWEPHAGERVFEALGWDEVAKEKVKDFRATASGEQEGEEWLQTWRRGSWKKERIRSRSRGSNAWGQAASEHLLGA